MSLYPTRANVSDACRSVSRFGVDLNVRLGASNSSAGKVVIPAKRPPGSLIQGGRHRDDIGSGEPAFVPSIELIVLAANASEERLLPSYSL